MSNVINNIVLAELNQQKQADVILGSSKQITKDISNRIVSLLRYQPDITPEKVLNDIAMYGVTYKIGTVITKMSQARSVLKAEQLAIDAATDSSADTVTSRPPLTVVSDVADYPAEIIAEESDEEILERISNSYKTLDIMTKSAVNNGIKSLIISGPPGVGKSHSIEKALCQSELVQVQDGQIPSDDDIFRFSKNISGAISPSQLYLSLYQVRNNGVLLLDDCDNVFNDVDTLNILKAVLEKNDNKKVSWCKRNKEFVELGIPMSFEFKGTVIFLTNVDFDTTIAKETKISQHLPPLMDRSWYLSLGMNTTRELIIRIRQVCEAEDSFLRSDYGLDSSIIAEIMDFVEEHKNKWRTISFRLIVDIAEAMMIDGAGWKNLAIAMKTNPKNKHRQ